MTGETAGQIDADGNTGETGPDTTAHLGKALGPGGEATEEFGICFDGICSIGPSDPEHGALVIKHLGALSGHGQEPGEARPMTGNERQNDRVPFP